MDPLERSAAQNGAQSLGYRLVEDVVVERVQKIFPVALAGKEIADFAVHRAPDDLRFDRVAFDGELHLNQFSST
jgi:hypothetical protein